MNEYLILATGRRKLGGEIRALSMPLKKRPKNDESPTLIAVRHGQVRAEFEWRRVTKKAKRIATFESRRAAVGTLKRIVTVQSRWAFNVFPEH